MNVKSITRRELLAGATALAARAATRPNILFLMADEFRFDALGAAGHPVVKTPHLDRLAREGTRFASTYTVSPVCSPARASLFTGRYAHVHGLQRNGTAANNGEIFLPSILSYYRYHTAISGKLHFRPKRFDFGFDRFWSFSDEGPTPENGYFAYMQSKHGSPAPFPKVPGSCPWPDDPLGKDVGLFRYPPEDFQSEWITDRAVEYLRSRQGNAQPWFLFVSYLKPHSPSVEIPRYFNLYDPERIPVPKLPPNIKEMRAAAKGAKRSYVDDERMERVMSTIYYGSVTHTDAQIGRVLAELE
ncbi:MAG: sulfatase-like hydrolase/transferase, partial [Bryobacteraceae bacterium]